jgi:beta-lactam-binding protein with PASTA domain
MEVSGGGEHVSVPNVVGLPLQEALERLCQAHLVAASGDREAVSHADDRPPGPVAVGTDPPAGRRVPAGSEVRVHIGVPADYIVVFLPGDWR